MRDRFNFFQKKFVKNQSFILKYNINCITLPEKSKLNYNFKLMKYTIRVKMDDGKFWKVCDCTNSFSMHYWLNYYIKRFNKDRIIIKPY